MSIQYYRGYVTPRSFGPYRMPIPLQNIIYRHSATTYDISLSVPSYEINEEGMFSGFYELLNWGSSDRGIILITTEMLPGSVDNKIDVLKRMRARNISVRFILENLYVSKKNEYDLLEEVLFLTSLESRADTLQDFLS